PLRGNGPWGPPVLIHHNGCDALRHQIRCGTNLLVRVPESAPLTRAIVSMGVDIDKPWRHVFARGIDDARGLGPGQATQGDDASVPDADVGRICRIPGAVIYTAALDEEVEGLRCHG